MLPSPRRNARPPAKPGGLLNTIPGKEQEVMSLLWEISGKVTPCVSSCPPGASAPVTHTHRRQIMNLLKIMAVAFLAVITVAGCATPYQQRGLTGGFSETQLAENVFEVRFRGNGYTSSERASDFALLRSAELTLEKGFKYFIVDDDQNISKTTLHTSPARSYTTYTGFGSSYTTTYGGDTYAISKPRARKVIICFKEKPDWPGLIYEAQFVVQSLKGKYETQLQRQECRKLETTEKTACLDKLKSRGL